MYKRQCQASTDLLVSVQGGTYIHTEGMGRSLLEAMCLGVKIVVSECGAVSEIIDDENGTLVPLKENEKIFAEQIEKTLLLPPIAQQKRKAYCEQYSFERIFQQYRIFWQ